MFDTFFSQIKVRSRMESGPIGPHLSEIAAVLHRDGYSRGTIRRHLRAADHFGACVGLYLNRRLRSQAIHDLNAVRATI